MKSRELFGWRYPWVAVKTWFHLLWNAHEIAACLDDCTHALGQMRQAEAQSGMRMMTEEKRSKLLNRACWHALPQWKWREDDDAR